MIPRIAINKDCCDSAWRIATWDQLPISVIALDAKLRVIDLNPRAEKLLGVSRGDFLATPAAEVFSHIHVDDLRWLSGERQRGKVITRADGFVDVEIEVRQVASAGNNYVLVFCFEPSPTEMAGFDTLTGLPDRAAFDQRLQEAFDRRDRQLNYEFAVLFVDVDRLKPVNDEWGHEFGDRLLRLAAQRLRHCIRENDLISRRGGDEFTILLDNIVDMEIASIVAERILRAFDEPFALVTEQIAVGVSVGIAFPSTENDCCHTLLHAADQAMYTVKRAGGIGYAY